MKVVSQIPKNFVVYENDDFLITHGFEPISIGHARIFPKKPLMHFEKMDADQFDALMQVSFLCASIIFESAQAHGISIIATDNNPEFDRFCINVIARFENDGLKLQWTPKENVAFEQTVKLIQDALIIPTKKVETKPVAIAPKVETLDFSKTEKEKSQTVEAKSENAQSTSKGSAPQKSPSVEEATNQPSSEKPKTPLSWFERELRRIG